MTNADILACFPGPVRLKRPRWKNLLIFIVFGLLAVKGIGDPVKFKMWLPLICFGPVAVFNLLALLPWANALTLRRDRLQWSHGFIRWSVPWGDANDFTVFGSGRYARTAFKDYRKSAGRMSALGSRLFVLSHTFGRTPDELAALLTQWRERALTAGHTAPAVVDSAPRLSAANG
jgi:hypothetical protein